MKQNAFNALSTVMLMVLLCWTIKQHFDLKSTQEVLYGARTAAIESMNSAKELQSTDQYFNRQLNDINDRLKDVENGWHEFLDFLFAESEPAEE